MRGKTDSNRAENICPARFFASSGPANHRIDVARKRKNDMNLLTQSKQRPILPLLFALTLGCFWPAPQARAACREGCDLFHFNTFLGADALLSNTSGESNTAIGSGALTSNTTGFDNTADGSTALFSNTSGFANT